MDDDSNYGPASERLERELADVRAELMLTQATLATIAVEVAKQSLSPKNMVGDLVMKILGFGAAAAQGLQGRGNPRSATKASTRLVDWIEAYLAGG